MLVEFIVKLFQGISICIGIGVTLVGSSIVVEDCVEHVYVVLHTCSLVVVGGPRRGETHLGLERHLRAAGVTFLGGDEDNAIGSTRAVER